MHLCCITFHCLESATTAVLGRRTCACFGLLPLLDAGPGVLCLVAPQSHKQRSWKGL